MYDGVNTQITFSQKLIDRLNNNLTIITENQQSIVRYTSQVEHKTETWFTAIVSALTLENVARQVINNCLLLITLIEELENSINFGNLNIANLSVIKTTEMLKMVDFIQKKYPNNFVEFNSIMTYYQVIKTNVYLERDRIIFVNHMP